MGKSLIKSIFLVVVLRTFYVICAAFIVVLLQELFKSDYNLVMILTNTLSILLAIISMVNIDRILDERRF